MRQCSVHGATVALDCEYCEPVRRGTAFAHWIAGIRPWDLTVTLTYDPKRRKPTPPGPQRHGPLTFSPRVTETGIRLSDVALTRDVATSKLKRFLRSAPETLGEDRKLAGVLALELHNNSWPHWHGLIAIDTGLQDGDIAKLGRLWFGQNGGNRIERPRSIRDCAIYAAKYMSKDPRDGDVLFWPPVGSLSGPGAVQQAFPRALRPALPAKQLPAKHSPRH
jgi:hypothetical protein